MYPSLLNVIEGGQHYFSYEPNPTNVKFQLRRQNINLSVLLFVWPLLLIFSWFFKVFFNLKIHHKVSFMYSVFKLDYVP